MKRHSFSPAPLIVGLLFAGLAVIFGLDRADVVAADIHWLGPIALIAVGLATLAGSFITKEPDA